MKYLLILAMAFLLYSCKTKSKDDKNTEVGYGITVLVVNGCQYVVYVDGQRGGVTMVHAGNCSNQYHTK